MPPTQEEEMRELVAEEDPALEQTSDDNTTIGTRGQRWKPIAITLCVGALCAGVAVFAVQHFSQSSPSTPSEREMEAPVVGFESAEASAFGECTPDATEWAGLTSVSVEAHAAVTQALSFLAAKRHGCMGADGALSTPPKEWLKGVNHSHSVHVEEKCLASLKAKAYKLYFEKTLEPPVKFMIQLHVDLETHVYSWVSADPAPCDIKTGSASGPEQMNLASKRVSDMGKFAVKQLNYRAKQCLPGGASKMTFTAVTSAVSQVTNALQVHMGIDVGLVGANEPSTSFYVTVVQRCADDMTKGKCINQLAAPDGDVCKVFYEPAEGRRLERYHKPGGAEAEDFAEIFDAQLRHMDAAHATTARKLSAERLPLRQRYIKTGSVPSSFDPRGNACYQNVKVYDQGSCGSCYAQAWAAMMGIRYCLHAKGRRLEGGKDISPPEENRTAASARQLASCSDSTQFSAGSGRRRYTCSWFARNDPGCKEYKDYGQMTSCKKTCGTCPTAVSQSSSSNPWYGAWYNYMPAVEDVASCSKSDEGVAAGCNGGNSYKVWNNNIQHLTRDLNVMGAQCMPYTMKCTESSGIVNPLTGGHCSQYQGYQLWHKPCSCIPTSQRPSSHTCPSYAKSGCAFTPPAAAFTIKSVAQGLSATDAMNNMMRHINEFGPIYIAFSTTTAFMNWDWSKNPVYTGGGHASGGHAVMAVGWGTYRGTKYWLLRNSWGADWADGGYAKFKRGVNLDGIESSGPACAMPTSNFQDWSPPTCILKKWSYKYSHYPTSLASMTGSMDIQCDKSATVKVFMSNILAHRDDIYDGVGGQYKTINAHAGINTISDINLICRGFGLKQGEMWVQITADDGHGNTGESSHFITYKAVPDMSSIHSSARSKCR